MLFRSGFDTFAFRQPAWARALKIFEVDQSATQAMKLSQLAKARIAMPPNVNLAAIDFEQESLLAGLLRHNISLAEPTFFSWLGVTMYLRDEAVDVVFRSVAKFPADSEIVFTFMQPPERITVAYAVL